MIGTGLVRAPLARKQIWLAAIAGLALGQVLVAPAARSSVAGNPDGQVGRTTVTACGHGVSAVNLTLPRGFNARTATNAQLVANDLPARPAGRAELAAWRRFVTGRGPAARSSCAVTVAAGSVPLSIIGEGSNGAVTRAASIIGEVGVATNLSIIGETSIIGEAGLVGNASIIGEASPATAATRSASIIGEVTPLGTAASPLSIIGEAATGSANQVTAAASAATSFNDAYGTWRVTRPARGRFAGLALGSGSSAAQPLVQAGSAAARGGGRTRYSLWWRVFPQESTRQRVSLRVSRGDTVYAHIRLAGSQVLITVRDESTGAGGTYLLRLAHLG